MNRQQESGENMRLDKFLARSGVASRRSAAQIIRAGRVAIGGRVVDGPGYRMSGDEGTITVDGKAIDGISAPDLYIALNKPRGHLSTRRDPRGRPTVMDLLPSHLRSVFPVGRLDAETTGLIVLTTDGDLALRISHPRWEVKKVYEVEVKGCPKEPIVSDLKKGVPLADGWAHVAGMEWLKAGKASSTSFWRIILKEGRYRQIRRLFATVGHPVVSLCRIAVGPVTLEGLNLGCWRHLSDGEVDRLRRAVGLE